MLGLWCVLLRADRLFNAADVGLCGVLCAGFVHHQLLLLGIFNRLQLPRQVSPV